MGIKEWTGLEWNIIQRKAENREEWRKLVVKSPVRLWDKIRIGQWDSAVLGNFSGLLPYQLIMHKAPIANSFTNCWVFVMKPLWVSVGVEFNSKVPPSY